MDWGALIQQVPSIAVAVLFAWFVDRIQSRWAQQIEDRDAMWREFLDTQRDRHAEATARLAEEIKAINQGLAANTQQLLALSQLLVQHDTRVQYSILEEQVKNRGRKSEP